MNYRDNTYAPIQVGDRVVYATRTDVAKLVEGHVVALSTSLGEPALKVEPRTVNGIMSRSRIVTITHLDRVRVLAGRKTVFDHLSALIHRLAGGNTDPSLGREALALEEKLRAV